MCTVRESLNKLWATGLAGDILIMVMITSLMICHSNLKKKLRCLCILSPLKISGWYKRAGLGHDNISSNKTKSTEFNSALLLKIQTC